MAIGRLSMKVGKAGKAAPHAAYLNREGPYAERLEQGEKLEATEAGNLPAWSQHNPQEFWKAADAHERVNGTTYREMEIALPRELDAAQRLALVREFVAQEIGETHAYQWAIHTPKAVDGEDQPHVHLMFSERRRDGIERDPQQYFRRYNAKFPEKGGAQKGYGPHAGQTLTAAQRAADLKALRGRWQEMANQHLERAGHAQRIDMRSHAERGTGQEPEAKQLPSQWRGEGRSNVLEFRRARRDQVEAAREVHQVIPNVPSALLDLGKAQARREFERLKAAQAQVERQTAAREPAAQPPAPTRQEGAEQLERRRIEAMSAAQLRDEISQICPPSVHDVVSCLPEIVQVRERLDALKDQDRQAFVQWNKAQKAMEEWRSAHPMRAKLHDSGLVHAAILTEAEQMQRSVKGQLEQLRPQIAHASQQLSTTYDRLTPVVQWEQAPARARVAEMEKLHEQRLGQERAERVQSLALDNAMKSFQAHALKREMKALGYGDTGEKWKAIAEPMRKMIEGYNALSKETRPVVLARIRENLQHAPQQVEKVVEQLNRGQGMDRGMSR